MAGGGTANGRPRPSGEARARPTSLYVLVGALAFQGVSGVGGGIGLVFDPSGASIGIPLGWLEESPFPDYSIPGIVLLSVLGLGPLVMAYGAWTGGWWSWPGSILVGVTLLLWLAVEVAVIGYQAQPPLQLIYGVVGAVILGAGLAPGVRDHLS